LAYHSNQDSALVEAALRRGEEYEEFKKFENANLSVATAEGSTSTNLLI
jgi:hypothetical protein